MYIYVIIISTLSAFLALDTFLSSRKLKIFFLMIFVVLYAIFCANRNIISDTQAYYEAYLSFKSLSMHGWEYFYQALEFIGKTLGLSFKSFLFFCGFIATFLFFYPYAKNERGGLFLIFGFWILSFSPILAWTVLRQDLALGVLTFLPFCLAKNEYKKAFFIILIAAGFHIGSLALLPLCIKINFQRLTAFERLGLSITLLLLCLGFSFVLLNTNLLTLIGLRSFSFYLNNAKLNASFQFSYVNFCIIPVALIIYHYYDLTRKKWKQDEIFLYYPLLYGFLLQVVFSFYGPFLPLRYGYFFIPFVLKLIYDLSCLKAFNRVLIFIFTLILIPHYVSLVYQHFSFITN
jgi:hypothetical protein